jgi:hypothetical protein
MEIVRFEVTAAESMKSTNSYNVTSYSLVEVHRCSRGIHCLHLQGRIVIKAVNQQETSIRKQFTCCLILALCLLHLLVDPDDGGSMFALVNNYQIIRLQVP